MLPQETKELLSKSKNLLAFSAGVDSTALLFLLLEHKIPFDIAIVDYGLRPQSKEEVAYAKKLAKEYSFNCYTLNAPKITTNFEAKARELRYDFFQNLIEEHSYNNLLTAHHLGDRFEWMMMQFCKGAGCAELTGMQSIEQRSNYRVVRPLLQLEKAELKEYLKANQIHYFEDESNSEMRYKRNRFRKLLSPLLAEYKEGIKRSFNYIDEDRALLIEPLEVVKINQLTIIKASTSQRSNIYAIDKELKALGVMMSAPQRALLKEQNSTVIARKYIVTQQRGYILIAPYIKQEKFTKEFKEKMRSLKIDPKLRAYLASDFEAVAFLSERFL